MEEDKFYDRCTAIVIGMGIFFVVFVLCLGLGSIVFINSDENKMRIEKQMQCEHEWEIAGTKKDIFKVCTKCDKLKRIW